MLTPDSDLDRTSVNDTSPDVIDISDVTNAADPGAYASRSQRMHAVLARLSFGRQTERYFFNMPVDEIYDTNKVLVNGQILEMYSSYSYLGLNGHPEINKSAKDAIDKYGTGTNGSRIQAGSLRIHEELEAKIAEFKHREAAIVSPSGYVANLSTIAALVGKKGFVISDSSNHASIIDGCLLSGAKTLKFDHNNMSDLERILKELPRDADKLVVVDAVFSMDGDIIDLPVLSKICKTYDALLMVDEAHSLGMLGKTGTGIEEYFGLSNVIDINMGTLSKVIPSSGGYIAGSKSIIDYLRHAARGYIFSGSLAPGQVAAATKAIDLICQEQWRVEKLQVNFAAYLKKMKELGIDTQQSKTAILPILCNSDEDACDLSAAVQKKGYFALPAVAPAVPQGKACLRTTITANHDIDGILRAAEVFAESFHRIKSGLLNHRVG